MRKLTFHKVFLASALTSLFGLTALSAEPLDQQQLRIKAAEIPQAILQSGTARIGGFDIVNFISQLSTVRYESVLGRQLAQGRDFLRYDVPTKTVFLPSEGYSADSIETSFILLHESLGALGYVDDNYQLSTTLFMLSGMGPALRPTKSLIDELGVSRPFSIGRRFTNPVEIKNNLSAREGGVTGAGGGGDPHGANIQAAVLYILVSLRDHFRLNERDITFLINSFDVETYATPRRSDLDLACLTNWKSVGDKDLFGIDFKPGLLTIYVPETCAEIASPIHDPRLQLPMRLAVYTASALRQNEKQAK